MSTRHRIAGGLLGLLLVSTAAAPAALGAGTTPVPGAGATSAAPAAGTSTTRTAAPSGSGSACTPAAPCTVDTALRASRPGEVVQLQDGDYASLRAVSTRSAATAERPVVVRPVAGADVTLDGLTVSAPGLVFRDLRSTGVVYVNPSATGLTLERVHVDGSGIFLRADGSRVLDSLVEGGSGLDGIQIKDADGALVQGTTVRDFDQTTGSMHADCVQLFDTRNVTLRGNTLHDCDNASIIFSRGGGKGISNVLVEGNWVTGCREVGPSCRGGTALDLREPLATNVVVRSNTFSGGSFRVARLAGVTLDRNLVGYLSTCDAPLTNSVVRAWNTGLCSVPPVLGRDGNRAGEADFVDRGGMDLRVRDAASVTVAAVPVVHPLGLAAARDHRGAVLLPTTAGAYEPTPTAAAAVPAPVVVRFPAGATTAVPGAPAVAGPPPAGTPTPAPVPTPSPSPTATRAPVPTTGGTPAAALCVAMPAEPAGSVRRGITTLVAHVTGGTASGVVFETGGRQVAVGSSRDGGRTWTATADTRLVPPGRHPVVAVASSAAGEVARSAVVTLTVAR